MRGLIFVAVLAFVGCGAHVQETSKKKAPAQPTVSEQAAADAAMVDAAREMAENDCAQERFVASYLASRMDKVLKAAKAWRAKAIELKEKSDRASADCK